MNVSQMKVKTQLVFGFALVLILMVITNVLALFSLADMDVAMKTAIFDRYPKVEEAMGVNDDINKIARATRTSLLTDDKTVFEDQLNVITKSRQHASELLQNLESKVVTPKGKETLAQAIKDRKPYGEGVDQFVRLMREGRKDEAKTLLLGRIREDQHRYMKSLDAFVKSQQDAMREAGQHATDTVAMARTTLLIIVVVALALGIGVALWSARNLMATLGGEPVYAADMTRRIARGDLSSRIELAPGDNASLLASMKTMQDTLQALVSEIQQVVTASSQGDFSKTVRIDGREGFGRDIGLALNKLNRDLQAQIGGRPTEAVAAATRIAQGDLITEVSVSPGDSTSLLAAMAQMRRNLNTVIEDVRQLVNAAAEGDFGQRMALEGRQGYAHTLAELLNRMMTHAESGLTDIQRVAQSLADGDLTQRINHDYPGLFGETSQAINTTVDNLTRLIGDVVSAVELINTAAEEIAAGNRDLSARTESQAASLQETASSVEEFTSMVQQNNASARQAAELSQSASHTAEQGGTVVQGSVTTMEEISASSKKIGDIIGVIDGIAFQTNILALNAAVEAARAGEQGRGFAVVASEVRNLAQRSAQAAKEIKELITDSVDKVDRGTAQAEQAGSTMDDIVNAIARVTHIMTDISHASMEQASGIEQINRAVSQMDEATQQNAALVEEAAAAAESLEEQARQLQKLVSAFRLHGKAAGSTRGAIAPRPQHTGHGGKVGKKPTPQKRVSSAPAPAAEWETF